MAYSYIRYTGDGSTTQYTFNFTLGYLTRDDVYAFVDDVSVPFTWVNDGIIDLVTPPVLGAAVLIRRIVDKEELIHDYNDGAVIIEKNLDDSNMQSIMAVHEMLDGFVDTQINETLNMNFNRIINILDPVDVLDAANKQYVDSFINVNVPMDVYEIQSLTSGQTEVVFSNDIIKSAFYLNGDDCDNGRLVEGVDYAADAVAKTITLAQSYPSGTRIILAGLTEVGSTVTGVRSVIDLSDLRSNTGSIDYPTCILQEEGRGGTFNWDSSDLSTEVAADTQSGIHVAPTSDLTGASGAWVRQYEGAVNAKWFYNNESDYDAAIQGALSFDNVFFPPGTYGYTTTINISAGMSVTGDEPDNTTLNFAGTGTAVDVQTRGTIKDVRIYKQPTVPLNTTDSGLLFSGSNGYGDNIAVVGFYKAAQFKGDDQGCAYNRLNARELRNNKYAFYFEAYGTGWSNENSVYGGRVSIDSAYREADTYGVCFAESLTNTINSNKFFGTSFENIDKGVLFLGCKTNIFVGCRFELDTGYSYVLKFKQDSGGRSPAENVIISGYGVTESNVLFVDNADVDLGYNPNNIILHRLYPTTVGADTIQLHTAGYRKTFIKYDLSSTEIQFINNTVTALGITAAEINFKGTRCYDFRTANYKSSSRPTNAGIGHQIYDTTLKKPVWWDGSDWRDAAGTVV